MFLINLVPLLLLVGVLYESGVDTAGHLREQPSDLRGSIVSVVENYCRYCLQHNTTAAMTLIEPDAKLLMDGFPIIVGHDEIRLFVESITERAARVEQNYKAVEPMDKEAKLVYSTLHFEFFNESGDNYMSGSDLAIFRKTPDGYKFYMLMFNKHNQSA